MTPKELWPQYVHYTRDLTEHGRKMGFAAGGICWLLRNDVFVFPPVIYLALVSLALYFIFDILQSLLGAIILRIFLEQKEAEMWEQNRTIDGDFEKPRWVDSTPFLLWFLKSLALIGSFLFIAIELLQRI